MIKPSESKKVGLFKKIFKLKAWSDWDRTMDGVSYLSFLTKRFTIAPTAKIKESFEEAVIRLNLAETDLLQQKKTFMRTALIMLASAVLLFFYTIFQLLYGSWHSAALSLIITALACVLAFRYHFWFYQITTRTLGCSTKSWFLHGVLRRKS